MKFNLTLDESLFEDFDEKVLSRPVSINDLDDDFSEYDSLENVPEGPSEGSDTGVASEIIRLINDEWEAIQGYIDAIATLRANIDSNPFYEAAIAVLEEISAEENAHVGQLQEVLRQISPNAQEISKGTEEAKSQLGLVDGVLPVQSWEQYSPNQGSPVCDNELCSIEDADDEM